MIAYLLLAACISQANDTRVIEFSAEWCQSCQEMEPVISQLEREGYSFERRDYDTDRKLATQCGVTEIPAFVVVKAGRVVQVVAGKVAAPVLRGLFGPPCCPEGGQCDPESGAGPRAGAGTGTTSGISNAVVRLSGRIGGGRANVGNGVVIGIDRTQGSRGAILTVAHLFLGATSLQVEFADGQRAEGRMIATDVVGDLALVEFTDPHRLWYRLVLASSDQTVGDQLIWGAWKYDDNGWRATTGRCRVARTYGITMEVEGQLWGESNSGGAVCNAAGELVGLISQRGPDVGTSPVTSRLVEFVRENGAWAITEPGERQRLGIVSSEPPPVSSPFLPGPDEWRPPTPSVPLPIPPVVMEPVEQEDATPTIPAETEEQPATEQAEAIPADQATPTPQSDLGNVARNALSAAMPWALTWGLSALGIGLGGPLGYFAMRGAASGITALGGSILRRSRDRRTRGDREGQAKQAEPFSATGTWPRDGEEAIQFLQLSKAEGRDPISDALIGRLTLDRLDAQIEASPDKSQRDWASNLKNDLLAAFNTMMPPALTTKAAGG